MTKVTKPIKAVATITQTEMNSEGIKVQLNQNDVLEVIVSERYDSIMEEIAQSERDATSLYKEFDDIIAAEKLRIFKEFVKKNKLPLKEEDFTACNIYLHNKTGENPVPIYYVAANRRGNHRRYDNKGLNSYTKGQISMVQGMCKADIAVAKEFKKVGYSETIRWSSLTHFKFSQSKQLRNLIERIEIHNKAVKVLNKNYADMDLSYEAIQKATRVAFNKKLIAGGSPKLKDKIKSLFNVEL